MVTSISPGFHQVHGVQLARSLGNLYRFPTLSLRAFAMHVAFPHSDYYAPSDCLEGLGAFGAGLPCLLSTLLHIPFRLSRVRHGGLKQDGLGGTFLVAPSTLCGSPVPGEGNQVLLAHLLQNRSCILHRSLCRQGGRELDWLTHEVRCVRGSLPRRAMRASGDSPCHLSAKHHLLDTYLLLMVSLRCMLLTLQSGLERLTPKAQRVPGYPTVLPHSPMSLSRRTERRLFPVACKRWLGWERPVGCGWVPPSTSTPFFVPHNA